MTTDELKRESFFQQLSDGQQKYVLARCSKKSKMEAAREAWNCQTDDSAKAMAYKAEKNANITWLINKFLGVGASRRVPTAEELAAWNWEKATSVGDPDLAIKFAQNVARIMGYEQRPAVAALPTKPPVDDSDDDYTPR
jgi:hypothetical protein